MKVNFWGIKSILFVLISLLIGGYSIIINNLILGIIYFAFIPFSFILISYFYCTKCSCRLNNCGHYFLGQLTRILPLRKNSKYSLFDYFGTMLPLLFLIGLSQYWLFKNIILLIIFWSLMLVSFFEVIFFVCKKCDNHKCAMCSLKK